MEPSTQQASEPVVLGKDKLRRLAKHINMTHESGRVERCHAIPHHGSYSNAAHQWGVAMLMFKLWPEDFARLGPAALFHDVPELWIGDIPAPMLREMDPTARADITRFEVNIADELDLDSEHMHDGLDYEKIKACDRLEFLMWCNGQLRLGNVGVQPARDAIIDYMMAKGLPSPADQLLEKLMHPFPDGEKGFLARLALKE